MGIELHVQKENKVSLETTFLTKLMDIAFLRNTKILRKIKSNYYFLDAFTCWYHKFWKEINEYGTSEEMFGNDKKWKYGIIRN